MPRAKQRILLARFRQNLLAIAHRDDRVVGRIGALDVVEIGRHDLDAGHLARRNHIRQRTGAKIEDVGLTGNDSTRFEPQWVR